MNLTSAVLLNNGDRFRRCFVIAVCFVFSAFGAFDGQTDWPASMGSASALNGTGAVAYWGNPAAIAGDELSSAVFFSREWGLDELRKISISTAKDLSWGSLSAGGFYFGSRELYSELGFGVAFSRGIGPFYTAVKAGILSASGGDWSATAPVLSLGALAHASKVAEVHLWADNVTMSRLDGNDIPVSGALGAVYKPTSWARLAFEAYSQSSNPASIRFGQEVFVFKALKLRCGIAFRPNTYHLGVGLKVKEFEFDWAYIGHPELGGSTQLGLIYQR